MIAGILGVAAVAGTFAATTSTTLGVEATSVSDAEIATRQKKLRQAERRLARAVKKRPPTLPAVARRGPAVLASAPAAAAPVVFSSGGGPGPSASSGHGGHHGHELEDEHDDDHRGRGRGRGRGGDDDRDDDWDDDRDADDWDDD
ncbi:MAG: hypothetical protein M3188_04050 [Actinomycetota bacterium]|nr:hypothetical protein [Actinomycetota bacterium]